MTAALPSRLIAAAIINVPLAWLMMSRANHRAVEAIAAGRSPMLQLHGFGYWLFGIMLFGLVYVLFVEIVAFRTPREINRRIASAGTSVVLAHENQRWRTKLLRKRNPYISQKLDELAIWNG